MCRACMRCPHGSTCVVFPGCLRRATWGRGTGDGGTQSCEYDAEWIVENSGGGGGEVIRDSVRIEEGNGKGQEGREE